jgi:hypothetical protein
MIIEMEALGLQLVILQEVKVNKDTGSTILLCHMYTAPCGSGVVRCRPVVVCPGCIEETGELLRMDEWRWVLRQCVLLLLLPTRPKYITHLAPKTHISFQHSTLQCERTTKVQKTHSKREIYARAEI